jgi:hypothetical protein
MTIERAKDGGFIVWDRQPEGFLRSVLFAGSLGECLDYIRKQFSAD